MEKREIVFQSLRKKSLRITKQRKAIIDILEHKHLTIQEIYEELKNVGYTNLATVYNNIDFLLENKIITQVFINGKRHYDLIIDDDSHSADSHIHIMCKANNHIIEINQSDIIDYLKNHFSDASFDIQNIQITAEGYCKYYNTDKCQTGKYCYILQKLSKKPVGH